MLPDMTVQVKFVAMDDLFMARKFEVFFITFYANSKKLSKAII